MKEELKDLFVNSKECVILMELLNNTALVKSTKSLLLKRKKKWKQLKNVEERRCLSLEEQDQCLGGRIDRGSVTSVLGNKASVGQACKHRAVLR